MFGRYGLSWLVAGIMGLSGSAFGGSALPSDFRPDPMAVQRYGPAYRYPQAGWIVLHIEGQPYERGYQHGRLMAAEIAAALRVAGALQSPKAPAEGWKNTRTLVNALFVRRYDQEYLEEMKGIAAGATAAGARFEDRPIDLVDIVGLNAWPELDTLDSALEATPTGLEGIRFPNPQPRAKPAPKPMHCSAFAATGPATADGKIVFGHITMFGLYPSLFYNVWLDVKPAKGHRVLMQSYPGGIQSGLDYYMNDAGLLVCETTLAQTQFNIKGKSEASRIRQALQYADNIDKAVEILKTANNGLYTNEWLLADIKTNEIAMFELGTAKTKLYRSSKHEWFGGTEGFYWGCNNTKDMAVRLETIPGVKGRPANVVWHPSDRDKTWLRLYRQYRGKMDANFGRLAFTTPPLAAYHSLDSKFTTTALARELKTWALFGPPLGRTWKPTLEEQRRYPNIRPMVSNPWTVLHAGPPAKVELAGATPVDLPKSVPTKEELAAKQADDKPLPSVPAWYGTILPKTDADTWLATAFADYEKIVSLDKALHDRATGGQLSVADRQRLAANLFAFRAAYLAGARACGDVPLAETRSYLAQDDWYRVAAGKGVLVLHELRRLLGDNVFLKLMDTFGRENAGKEVTAAQFQSYAEKISGKPLSDFFHFWLTQPGLPELVLSHVQVVSQGKRYLVKGDLDLKGPPVRTDVDVVVETTKGEVAMTVALNTARTSFAIETTAPVKRVVVDKYAWSAKANGGPFSVLSFYADLEHTLIVYGTVDEVPTNREAAEALQQAIRERWSNYTVPLKTDKAIMDNDLKSHHILLIGRPNTNALTARFQKLLPVTFGSQCFRIGRKTYAHPLSAVIAAAENPVDHRYALVVIAGLGAEATLQAAPAFMRRGQQGCEVLLLPHGDKPQALVVPPRELVYEPGHQQMTEASKGKEKR